MTSYNIGNAYRFHRQLLANATRPRTATQCYALACADRDAGKARDVYATYPAWTRGPKQQFAAIESQALNRSGLRLVGYADEIADGRRIDHTGWYADSHQDSKYRGVVLQFPARDGRALYVPAYEESDSGCYVIPLERGVPATMAGDHITDSYDAAADARDAAYRADSIAESQAEDSREYDEAWNLGREYADAMETARGYRQERRKLMATLATARRDVNRLGLKSAWVAAICEQIRGNIAALKESAREAYDEAQKVLTENPYLPKDAFNEGAGIEVL